MTLQTRLEARELSLTDEEERHVRHHLDALGRRLSHHPEPSAVLVLTPHAAQRRVEADLRVELGPLGAHLVSHQAAETIEHVVRLAVEDVERQLERRHASQRGEPSFGVPSRRPWRKRTPRRPESGAP